MSKPPELQTDSSDSTIFRIALGARIQSARKDADLTQEQLAERMNISPREAQRWEAGEINIKPSRLARLCEVLKCAITKLWPDKRKKK